MGVLLAISLIEGSTKGNGQRGEGQGGGVVVKWISDANKKTNQKNSPV